METKDPIDMLFDLCELLALHSCNDEYIPLLLGVRDEIEAQYMKLPLDADGVPIRPGDTLICGSGTETVAAVDEAGFCFFEEYGISNYSFASHYTHVKPDPVESLLMDFYSDAKDKAGGHYGAMRCVASDYAERIRKAVEE